MRLNELKKLINETIQEERRTSNFFEKKEIGAELLKTLLEKY